SNLGKLHVYYAKIDKTFHKLIRSPKNSEVASNSHMSSDFASNFDIANSNSDITNSNFDLGVPNPDFAISISQFSMDNMVNNTRTLKESGTVDVMYQSWCIQYPELEQDQSYELKFGLLHLLPKFSQASQGFHVMCSTIRSHGILEDYIKMKTFLFSLDKATKDWLYL
ncbi:hypothetical protein CR513_19993, partial [Mucuna pruriens]